MSSIPVALQLYSLRDAAKKDFLQTVRDAAAAGYEGVEFAGFFGQPAAAVRKTAADAGLAVAGAHVGFDLLQPDQFNATVDYHAELGNTRLVIPGLPKNAYDTPDARRRTLDFLGELTAKLKARGMRTGYHSHAFDFQPLPEGGTLYNAIGDGTPADFILQIDVGNTVQAGADPVVYLERYPGRAEQVHLKEARLGKWNLPIGAGDVPWNAIFRSCLALGATRWYIVEVEEYWGEPLECARQDRAILRQLGV